MKHLAIILLIILGTNAALAQQAKVNSDTLATQSSLLTGTVKLEASGWVFRTTPFVVASADARGGMIMLRVRVSAEGVIDSTLRVRGNIPLVDAKACEQQIKGLTLSRLDKTNITMGYVIINFYE